METVETKRSWFSLIYSAMTGRLFFFLLFFGALGWFIYSTVLFGGSLVFFGLSLGKVLKLRELAYKGWVSMKRALVCALSLSIALFSPAFGIMVACTYFLMFDKAGMDEVVPASIQEQFRDILKQSELS